MSTRSEVERRTAPGLLGWLERELSSFPVLRGFDVERVMRCEEYSEPGRLVVRAELPGVDPGKDVHVTVGRGLLRIQAHRREDHKGHRRSEFFYGEMVRTMMLPPGTDEKGIIASYKDGILEVGVPVSPDATSGSTAIPIIRSE